MILRFDGISNKRFAKRGIASQHFIFVSVVADVELFLVSGKMIILVGLLPQDVGGGSDLRGDPRQ